MIVKNTFPHVKTNQWSLLVMMELKKLISGGDGIGESDWDNKSTRLADEGSNDSEGMDKLMGVFPECR